MLNVNIKHTYMCWGTRPWRAQWQWGGQALATFLSHATTGPATRWSTSWSKMQSARKWRRNATAIQARGVNKVGAGGSRWNNVNFPLGSWTTAHKVSHYSLCTMSSQAQPTCTPGALRTPQSAICARGEPPWSTSWAAARRFLGRGGPSGATIKF